MKRKLVKQGSSTLMISLPSKWVKSQGLDKGQEVSIEQKDNSLILSAQPVAHKSHTTINLKGLTESSIRTVIVNAYRAGYDSLTLHFEDTLIPGKVLHILSNYLIGFDIIKQGASSMVLENITEPSEDQFDVLFKKIFFNIAELIDGTSQRLLGEKDFGEYEAITLKIHQYENYCRRVITKKQMKGSSAPLFWTFLSIMIHGMREIYHVNVLLDKKKHRFSSSAFLQKIRKSFDLLHQGYLKKDIGLLEELHLLEKEITYKDFPSLCAKHPKETELLFHLSLAAKHFYLANSPLIGLLMEKK